MRYSAGIQISELLSVCLDRLIFCKYIMKHIILTLLCYYIIYNVTSLYMFLGFTISIKMFHHFTSIFIFHQYVSLFHARVHLPPICFTNSRPRPSSTNVFHYSTSNNSVQETPRTSIAILPNYDRQYMLDRCCYNYNRFVAKLVSRDASRQNI